jgi:hypothetical protein
LDHSGLLGLLDPLLLSRPQFLPALLDLLDQPGLESPVNPEVRLDPPRL